MTSNKRLKLNDSVRLKLDGKKIFTRKGTKFSANSQHFLLIL